MKLKYLSNFWGALEMRLFNYEINIIQHGYQIFEMNREKTFAINDTKLFVPVVTLSTQDNSKPWQQLKSGFKTTMNWNKY